MNPTLSPSLPHSLERNIVICAPRETVFSFFTDSQKFASWWGAGSRIEPRPGGEVLIRYPNAVLASGEVVEIDPPSRIVMSYGYVGDLHGIPPGSTRVTITLEPHPSGTRLHLRHDLATAEERDHHVQGWRYQLGVFANVTTRDAHRGLESIVDRFLAMWSEPDASKRASELKGIAADGLTFHDAHSCTSGHDDLVVHIGAAQAHMPGMALVRQGAVRFCQGTALVDWAVRGPDGVTRGGGANVFDLGPDGRIVRVVGLWVAP